MIFELIRSRGLVAPVAYFVLGVASLSAQVPPSGPVVMVETFDTMTTGTQPTGFTVVNGVGTALTVSDIPSAMDKCMRFSDSSATTHVEATKTFVAQTSRFTTGFSLRQDGAADGHFVSLLSGSLSAIELYTVGGTLLYRDSAGASHVLQAISASTWYDIDLDVNPQTFKVDVYVDGVRKLTGANFLHATTSLDAIRFGTSDASATWGLYINDLLITQAPATFAADFNVLTTGSSPTGWTCSGSASPIVSATPSTTNKSMQFLGLNPPSTGEAYATFGPLSSRLSVSWSFLQTGMADGHRMALMAGATTTAVQIFTSGGNLVYKNAAGANVVIQAVPANAWYNVRVIMNPGTDLADVYVNDVLKLGNQSLRNPVTSVDRIVFGADSVTANANYHVDNVVVTSAGLPTLAPLAPNITRIPIILKLDDLSTSGGNVPAGWQRLSDFAAGRKIKFSVGLIAKSLETGSASYLAYIQGLKNSGQAEIWFHGYDHSSQEFNGKTYAVQKSRFTTSQSLALTKLGFPFTAFGAPENAFDNNTVQVMSEDANMKAWLYGDPSRPAGKRVLDRVGDVNIESPTFVPNPEQFVSGYLANYAGRQFFAIQGHPAMWSEAGWYDFVRLIDWLQANGFTFELPSPFEIIVDNTDSSGVTMTGAWVSSMSTPGYYGGDYLHDSNSGQGTKSVRFTPTIATAGSYEVFARWVSATNRSTQVPIDIHHDGGSATVTVNQRVSGSQWVSLGSYFFSAGTTGSVDIRNTGANGFVIADAVKFVKNLPVAITVDNADATGVSLTGVWTSSTGTPGYYGSDYLLDGNTGQGTKSVRFTPSIPVASNYEVFARWTAASNRSSQVPITITHGGVSEAVTVNQRLNGSQWISLGTYSFAVGTTGSVLIGNTGADGFVTADAVRLLQQ
jgi:hypothetical protein